MANYNYRSNDYMRYNSCPKQIASTPVRIEQKYTNCTDEKTTNCCTHDLLAGLPVAMAYVPWQEWGNIYSAEKALCRGTIFEVLDKPFLGKGGCCK